MDANQFGRMLAAMAEDHDREMDQAASRPLPEAQIDELRRIEADYRAGCRFKVGHLVTPRKGRAIRDAGNPAIVLEVFDPPIRILAPVRDLFECGNNVFGARYDMRVASFTSGDYVAFIAESWHYETWTGGR